MLRGKNNPHASTGCWLVSCVTKPALQYALEGCKDNAVGGERVLEGLNPLS